jgi:hypothetical protein
MSNFTLYNSKRGGKMKERSDYMKLLEGRAKRLNELLEVAAPTDMICQEVMLLFQAAKPLEPRIFKSWKEINNEEVQRSERFKCATG